MNSELLALLEYIEQERGINRSTMIAVLESLLISAARKSVDQPADDLRVDFENTTGEYKVLAKLEVVDDDEANEPNCIAYSKAKTRFPDVAFGDVIEWEVTPRNFGRIAAQTAKQAMMQQIKRAEKEMVYDEFKEMVGQIVNGIVRRYDSGNIVVDMGKAEGVLSYKDRIPNENYMPGDRINALLIRIEATGSGPSVILSRTNKEFVRKLFEREVSEIHDNIVEIKAIAREPGLRTKIAVHSNDPHIDPIGACVGMRGMRVKNITSELGGEKIDIIKYDPELKPFISNALQPASILSINTDEDSRTVSIIVEPEQLSLAIGKRGQNVRLTSKLVGWKVNVTGAVQEQEQSFQEKIESTVAAIAEKLSLDTSLADKLVKSGFVSIEGMKAAEKTDIEGIEGISPDELEAVISALKKIQD
ncbi:MAG: transcription termination/antitermination protein NusA [Victivallales bacterium]|nr:transcription termination/antitermination protein NusA [Victivallales bacterium]